MHICTCHRSQRLRERSRTVIIIITLPIRREWYQGRMWENRVQTVLEGCCRPSKCSPDRADCVPTGGIYLHPFLNPSRHAILHLKEEGLPSRFRLPSETCMMFLWSTSPPPGPPTHPKCSFGARMEASGGQTILK